MAALVLFVAAPAAPAVFAVVSVAVAHPASAAAAFVASVVAAAGFVEVPFEVAGLVPAVVAVALEAHYLRQVSLAGSGCFFAGLGFAVAVAVRFVVGHSAADLAGSVGSAEHFPVAEVDLAVVVLAGRFPLHPYFALYLFGDGCFFQGCED